MPKSRIRRKSAFTPPTDLGGEETPRRRPVRVGNPRWLVPAMITFLVLGLLWIVVYYVTQTEYPVGSLGAYNMVVGFGLVLVGFGLAMRWK